ncbi:MAG: hypothetical protein HN826_11070 [Methylococcales bacterium]|jgi:hypothetical protein|nr:hypothetical protein [Methylococcales bacterium]
MKLSTKAVIYSGFVFPGAGYFFVNNKKKGFICFATILVCLSFIMYEANYKVQIIAQNIMSSGVVPMDIDLIRAQVATVPGIVPPAVLSIMSLVIVLIWGIGIFDSYRRGKKLDDQKYADRLNKLKGTE